MGLKVKAQGNKRRQCTTAEAPLTAYDEIRMKQCMRNNSRLQQLGIRKLSNMFASTFSTSDNTKNNIGDSGSEYDPEEDDTSEGDLRDGNVILEADALQELESAPPSSIAKYSRKNCNKHTKSTNTKRTATMPPGGFKPCQRKRVLAEAQPQHVQTARVTRSKKNYANEIPMPAADEVVDHNCHNEGNMVDEHDEQNQNANGAEGDAQLAVVAATAEQSQNDNQTDAEDEDLQLLGEERIRGNNMGKGLDRMSRSRRAKLALTIEEGRTRLTEPVEDGQHSKTVTEVVSEVLAEKTKTNSFLQNVGIQPAPARRSKGDLEAQLAMEKRGSDELREIVNTQRQEIDLLSKKMQEAEAARAKKDEEMMKKQAETNALIRRLMAMIPQTRVTR